MQRVPGTIADVSVLTPLDEEWRYFSELIRRKYQLREVPSKSITHYTWKHSRPSTNAILRCHSAAAGHAGQTKASVFVQQVVQDWQPKNVIMLGIAGSLDKNKAALGDVLIPFQIIGYELGKVIDSASSIADFEKEFRITATQVHQFLYARARAFMNDPDAYKSWQNKCAADRTRSLFLKEHCPPKPSLIMSENDALASGNEVVASKNFATYLKKRVDPRLVAVDMESSGLFTALHFDGYFRDGLMVRGISDYADKKKNQLERQSRDTVRKYATRNATRFLLALLDRSDIGSETSGAYLELRIDLNSTKTAIECGMFFNNLGAQHLVFDNSVCVDRPCRDLALEVFFPEISKDRGLEPFVFERNEGNIARVIHPAAAENGRFYFDLGQAVTGQRFSIGVTSPEAHVSSIWMSLKDHWGVLDDATWVPEPTEYQDDA